MISVSRANITDHWFRKLDLALTDLAVIEEAA